MKKFPLSAIAVLLCSLSCSLNNERTVPSICDDLYLNALLTKASIKSLDDLCYHEGTELVLQPSRFDYTRTGNEPTHRAIKFFPKNLAEQQLINSSEDVRISYIPFGYIPAPPEIQTLAKDLDIAVFSETGPYADLPAMYVLWPLSKPLPDGIEFEECFTIFVPTAKEKEGASTKAEIVQDLYPARFRTHDGFLNTYLPLHKLAVHITNGYIVGTQYTNSSGRVYIDPYLVDIDTSEFPSMSVYVTLNNQPKWKITRDGTTPVHKSLGYVGNLWPNSFNSGTKTFNMVSISTEYEVHRALDYYHYDSTPYSTIVDTCETHLVVCAVIDSLPGVDGKTDRNAKIVSIYNNGNTCNNIISDVLHELGHIRHKYHYYSGINSAFQQVDTLLIESYGCYMGWYLGEQYYLSKGYVKTDSTEIINHQWRQDWSPSSQLPYYRYSPLFIDLIDNYNQGEFDPTKVFDDINEFQVIDIESAISTCTTVSQCKATLFYPFIEDKLDAYFSYYEVN